MVWSIIFTVLRFKICLHFRKSNFTVLKAITSTPEQSTSAIGRKETSMYTALGRSRYFHFKCILYEYIFFIYFSINLFHLHKRFLSNHVGFRGWEEAFSQLVLSDFKSKIISKTVNRAEIFLKWNFMFRLEKCERSQRMVSNCITLFDKTEPQKYDANYGPSVSQL